MGVFSLASTRRPGVRKTEGDGRHGDAAWPPSCGDVLTMPPHARLRRASRKRTRLPVLFVAVPAVGSAGPWGVHAPGDFFRFKADRSGVLRPPSPCAAAASAACLLLRPLRLRGCS